MKRQLDELIAYAMEVLDARAEIKDNQKCFEEVYKSYLSALGASIMMSGLLPALAFYEKDRNTNTNDRRAEGNRAEVLDWIEAVLRKKQPDLLNEDEHPISLYRYAIHLQSQGISLSNLETDVLDAALALKLSIRTYKLIGKTKNRQTNEANTED